MKIVNIILSSQNGGAEQVFIDYLMLLQKLNHKLLAITKEDAPYKDKVTELGIELKTITNHFGYHDFFAVKKIRKILEEFEADAVIAHVGRSVVLVRSAIGKNRKVKLIAVNHSSNVKRSVGSDVILSVNKEIFFKTVDLGQSAATSFVVANAVDLSDAISVAPHINFSEKNEIVIGAMGRLEKCKGFDVLLYALAELQKSDKKFLLKIAGSGVEEKNLRNIAANLGLEDKVEFCGWIKDKKKFFEKIDIFCMPSTDIAGETFGLVLLEAMKYRKAIVTTACNGPKEVVRDKIDGLLVSLKGNDALEKRLAKAILEIVNNQELHDAMIQNSFTRLEEKFSYSALEKRLAEVVGKVL
jgi:glycosyltransferase involved in cell wall biosynthesis